MARRPQALKSLVVTGAGPVDQVIKATPGILYGFNIQWSGGNVGDVIHIHDTPTADATATKRFTFQFPTTAGSFSAQIGSVGIEYFTGLWLNFQVAGPNVNLTITFD